MKKNLTEYLDRPGFYYCEAGGGLRAGRAIVVLGGAAYWLLACHDIDMVIRPADLFVRPLQNITISGDIVAIEQVKIKL